MPLYLVDPDPSACWAPFTDSRPLATLRVGCRTVVEWWQAASGALLAEVVGRSHLDGFHDLASDTSIRVTNGATIPGPAIVGRSDFVPTSELPCPADDLTQLEADDTPVGWFVPPGKELELRSAATRSSVRIDGLRLEGVYDLITALERLLSDDLQTRVTEAASVPAGVTVLGDPSYLVIDGGSIEPGAVVDVRAGPIVIEQRASIRSDSRLEGPLWIGPHTSVLGGPIARSAIGPWCNVRGEITDTVMLGYANKSHDGFVGHTVIGEWANLGANTVTSNLKNTYGPVRLTVDGERIETGRTLLGSLIGDHAKTAIGTLLGTGTVIGCGANVFGPARPPGFVRPFAWGADGKTEVTREGFLATASRVLPRRHVVVDVQMEAFLGRLYDGAVRTR